MHVMDLQEKGSMDSLMTDRRMNHCRPLTFESPSIDPDALELELGIAGCGSKELFQMLIQEERLRSKGSSAVRVIAEERDGQNV